MNHTHIIFVTELNTASIDHIFSVYCKLGEVNLNLTSLYDIVTQMSNRQTVMQAELLEAKEKLEETERKLNETIGKLQIRNKH